MREPHDPDLCRLSEWGGAVNCQILPSHTVLNPSIKHASGPDADPLSGVESCKSLLHLFSGSRLSALSSTVVGSDPLSSLKTR